MISVIIPNYNGVNVVQRAIDSVIAQEIADIEIIVVDDCSTDASCDVVRSYGAKVCLIALLHNLRVNGARNAGLDACRHDCVMFLDNDDYLLPRTLAAWRQDLQESGADVVIGPMLYEFNGHLTGCERAAMPPYGLRLGVGNRRSVARLMGCSALRPMETVYGGAQREVVPTRLPLPRYRW